MYITRNVIILSILLFIAGCGGSSSSSEYQKNTHTPSILLPENRAHEFSLNTETTKVYLDVAYGNHERQTLDLFIPNHTETMPLIIYLHGGGFTHGGKNEFYDQASANTVVNYLMNNKIAFALVNYRLLPLAPDIDDEGILKPMGDITYALQFLRYFSDRLNVNTNKIGLVGSSAGAGSALWINTVGDQADPDNSNLIKRESTLVSVVALSNTQSTYDFVKWETEVFPQGQWTLELDHRTQNIYGGVEDLSSLYSEQRLLDYRSKVDMLAKLSSQDGAIYIYNTALESNFGDPLHHPYHSQVLYNQASAAGISTDAYIEDLGINTLGTAINPFLYVANFLTSQ